MQLVWGNWKSNLDWSEPTKQTQGLWHHTSQGALLRSNRVIWASLWCPYLDYRESRPPARVPRGPKSTHKMLSTLPGVQSEI